MTKTTGHETPARIELKTESNQYLALRGHLKMTYALHAEMIIESADVDHAEVLRDESVRDPNP